MSNEYKPIQTSPKDRPFLFRAKWNIGDKFDYYVAEWDNGILREYKGTGTESYIGTMEDEYIINSEWKELD